MKTFEFSKDSWHYKLMDNWDPSLTRNGNIDLCSYTRGLFFALIIHAIIIGFITILAGGTLYSIGNLYSFLFLGYVLDPFSVIILLVEVLMGALVGFIFWNEKRKLREIENPSKPGFIGLAYLGWKEKFCARIEFK